MNKEQFRELTAKGIPVLDGATGTNLMEAGMPVGVCPEKWILENPEVIIKLQSDFIKSGSNIIYAPTFTCNRIKLAEYHLADKVREMNMQLVALSKKAVAENNHRGYVAGDMTMTGRQLYPIGDLRFEELVDIYKEQAEALYEAGCDLIVIETMMSLSETRAALIAVKEVCDLPVICSMTFNEDGKTLYGTTPEVAVIVLQELGADAVGINCSTGPDRMTELVAAMKEYATVPVFAKPNAGMPELVDGKTVYRMQPDEFARDIVQLIHAGASFVGGCCGSTPAHISAVKRAIRGMEPVQISDKKKRVLTSERLHLDIALDGPFQVIGERINPTGKKKLQASLMEGSLDMVTDMAVEQESCHAAILDINMGMNGIDEKDMMLKSIYEVTGVVSLPLCIDSSHIDIIEAALRIYPGRALINSISYESAKCIPLLKIAKKYGAMCILLPVSDKGLPESCGEKREIVDKLVSAALAEGLSKEDLIVDGLVSTVGASREAALMTLDTIRYCHDELKIPTVCGLSNISFGLPERINVNTAFLTMAIANGLTMAIANPGQTQLMNAAYASDLLLAKEDSDNIYVQRVKPVITKEAPAGAAAKPNGNASAQSSVTENSISPVYDAVINGNKKGIIAEVKKRLENNITPKEIIDNELIPAIVRVGELFEEKKYFLPQLISGANAMDSAIEYLSPMLESVKSDGPGGTIVFATVEGDIHDIGKNLCVLMLKNYGYNVIDMGKDVPAEDIAQAAVENDADIIGLSALMTTTMMKMKEVVKVVRERNIRAKVIIGGAVISQGFADEIGADGYSKDANDCVRLVKSLLKC